jgi:hypothetical protein
MAHDQPTVLLGDFNTDRATVASGLGAAFTVANLPPDAPPQTAFQTITESKRPSPHEPQDSASETGVGHHKTKQAPQCKEPT